MIAALDSDIQEELKRAVAKKAVDMVQSGQIIGLGTGSTSALFIEELGLLMSKGKVRTSGSTCIVFHPAGMPAPTLMWQTCIC
jgi:ribose 5-phosphate isomerase A